MVCKCRKHENAHDWMRINYDPKRGLKNMDKMYNEIRTNHIQVNSIRVNEDPQPQQRYRMADIEELPTADSNTDEIDTELYNEVNFNPIMVNRVPIGEACSPYEVIRVQTESGIFPIVIIYDTGSEVSLCNYKTGPIVSDTKRGNKKVTISTKNSIQANIRQVYKLVLNDSWSMEAIMIPSMRLCLLDQIIPEAWQDLNREWADQDTYGVAAQILLGADHATLCPHAVKDRTGPLLQVSQARLMRSEITGRYIIFGSCSRHTSHSRSKNIWIRNNQFQESGSQSPSDEALISIMGSISLDDVDHVEISPDKD